MSLHKMSVFCLFCLLSAFTGTADAYYFYMNYECIYSTRDYSDMMLLVTLSFNKVVELQYNSTLGKFVGFTELGIENAEMFNNNLEKIKVKKLYADAICTNNARIRDSAVRDKRVKPKIKISSVKQDDGRHPAVLMCSAYEFYPERIKVYWLRDGAVMSSEVTSTLELANGDWYHQIHSELIYNPQPGEKIQCVVEHASANKPIITDWVPLKSARNQITIGAFGLVLGLVIATAGLIYYKKKSAGLIYYKKKSAERILVPN